MTKALNVPTTEFEKKDRCAGLNHRPRVLLGKMGLDGHDRGVKVIARALRDSGVHVIYSGLWQTPRSLAISARDEDCDVLAASMMSNSHLVLGPALIEELERVGRRDIPIHMGGILPQEDLKTLLAAGIARCFPTGTGLNDIVEAAKSTVSARPAEVSSGHATAQLARDISLVHDGAPVRAGAARRRPKRVIGMTGSPGAGKSTLVAQLVGEYTRRAKADPSLGRCAVVAFDPKSPITGGALLGDRLRVDFNNLEESVFYRSLAISGEDYHAIDEIIELVGGCGQGETARRAVPPETARRAVPPYETVFVETVGAGQNETKIRTHVDSTIVVLTPGMGDAVQMDKAGILEIADIFVCNKADHPGENELVRDLRDVAGRRQVLETVATRAQGIPELLDAILKA
jgi:methylmalonyl-CoA mutase cobalamin-binding domain/chain